MVSGTIHVEYVVSVSVERLWKAGICDAHELMPKLLPHIIASTEIIGGDGGVGTIKKFNFTDAVEDCKFVKDRVEVIDNENHIYKYSVVEGGLVGRRVKSYAGEIVLTSVSGGKCLAKLNIEYEPLGATLSEDEITNIKTGNLAMVKAIEMYLLANPDAYA